MKKKVKNASEMAKDSWKARVKKWAEKGITVSEAMSKVSRGRWSEKKGTRTN